MNTLRNVAITAIYFAAAPVVLAPPSFAADIVTDVAPPPPRLQHAPPPRDGYVWDAGHWAWSGTAYYWMDGGWVVQRRRLARIADQWQQVGDKWHFVPAHWQPAP